PGRDVLQGRHRGAPRRVEDDAGEREIREDRADVTGRDERRERVAALLARIAVDLALERETAGRIARQVRARLRRTRRRLLLLRMGRRQPEWEHDERRERDAGEDGQAT